MLCTTPPVVQDVDNRLPRFSDSLSRPRSWSRPRPALLDETRARHCNSVTARLVLRVRHLALCQRVLDPFPCHAAEPLGRFTGSLGSVCPELKAQPRSQGQIRRDCPGPPFQAQATRQAEVTPAPCAKEPHALSEAAVAAGRAKSSAEEQRPGEKGCLLLARLRSGA
jgi:hypothetical protein